MSLHDPAGHYRIIGLAPRASAWAIHKAYHARAAAIGAGGGKRAGADMQSAALEEAYRVLSDPERRADYDVSGHDPADGPLACSRCRRVSAQLRYVIFDMVIGQLIRVFRDHTQGIYCPACARDVGVASSLLTWGIGWWGLPDGPLATVRAVWRNARGGRRPRAANAVLLAHQARAFDKDGKAQLARALAREALELVSGDGPRAELERILDTGEGDVPRLKERWRPGPSTVLVNLSPGLLILVLVAVLALRSLMPVASGIVPVMYVSSDSTVLREGPGRQHPVLANLSRFDTVLVTGGAVGGGWLPVVVGSRAGFIHERHLTAGGGEQVREAWCADHPDASANHPACKG